MGGANKFIVLAKCRTNEEDTSIGRGAESLEKTMKNDETVKTIQVDHQMGREGGQSSDQSQRGGGLKIRDVGW